MEDLISLDYIFDEDYPLDEWLAEREDLVLNDADFIDETMPDVAEAGQDGNRCDGDGNDSNDDEVIPSLILERASPSPPPFRNLLLL